MSTTIQESSLFGVSVSKYDEIAERFVFSSPRSNSAENESLIRFSKTERKSAAPETKKQTRVLRRFTGYLMEFEGRNARVAFVENGEVFQYDMPADRLQRSGIEIVNQPFQMDEFETRTDDGLEVGYRFRPLAKASDKFVETLDLDEEQKRKRDLILKKFAKAKA